MNIYVTHEHHKKSKRWANNSIAIGRYRCAIRKLGRAAGSIKYPRQKGTTVWFYYSSTLVFLEEIGTVKLWAG